MGVTLTDTLSGVAMSTYLYLRHDQGWKIEAYRALALPGFFYRVASMSEQELIEFGDSVAGKASRQEEGKEELLQLQRKARLITGTDQQLILNFKQHRTILEQVLAAVTKSDAFAAQPDLQATALFPKVANQLTTASINNVKTRPPVGNDCLWFVIEEISDNEVGYVYAEDEADLPNMSADRYILLKKITDHWYLYKTT